MLSEYEKMPDTLKKLGLESNDFSKLEKYKWVVTEKVHGANFSFVYEKNNLKFAKRKEYLSWKDDFFGYQLVVNKLEDKILRLFEKLSTQTKASKLIVYGELFGGKYPHVDVSIEEKVNAIQTGVYYSPTIEFYAFDIAVEVEGKTKYYLDYKTSLDLFEEFEIFHAKPLFIGKLNEAVNFNKRINSSIPKALNLPEIKDNLIEGIVIKPYNMDLDIKIARPIIKLKNEEFDEEKKFHQAEKWSFVSNLSSKTESLSFMMDELRNYITDNRLKSAISKIGSLNLNDQLRIEEIKTEFYQDVIVSFNENNDNILEELTVDEREWLKERIIFEVNKMIFS
ncbi:Rnl2 family RNA ligase [Flavobacterium sp. HSC-32F16]|uniref:RNA ligase family protein n=1 Tax=Flavobacterium sp. HSC-32F16 TaxID=2910964 RepID=UPI0020A377C8|nr:RNA ligase family protein [Flavobacterium sp. HSC-32F16]MCP2029118.1 Rnl2 family RNA ligase [Flavobacterium sp. HSC-32F16]